MGKWRPTWPLLAAGWVSAILITSMDLAGLKESLGEAWRIILGGR